MLKKTLIYCWISFLVVGFVILLIPKTQSQELNEALVVLNQTEQALEQEKYTQLQIISWAKAELNRIESGAKAEINRIDKLLTDVYNKQKDILAFLYPPKWGIQN